MIIICYLQNKHNYKSLFFVPILAYEKKFFLFCQNCRKNSTEIFGDDIKSAKEKVKLYRNFTYGKIDEAELNEGLNKIYAKYIGELNDKWECPDCHMENPNSSYRCVKCGYKVM